MTSIYEKVLGERFRLLHPRIQQRFGFCSEDRIASIGYGEMQTMWYNKLAAMPLYLGSLRHIMFPQGGRQIPFTIENYAYRDRFGRETVTWVRKFQFARKVQQFDATMIFSEQRARIVDYLGNRQHLAVDLDIGAADNGGILIRSGEQRFYEGLLQFRCPAKLTGTAEVCEWYEETDERFHIRVDVQSPLLGSVFRYQGTFQADYRTVPASSAIPVGIRPLREERRE